MSRYTVLSTILLFSYSLFAGNKLDSITNIADSYIKYHKLEALHHLCLEHAAEHPDWVLEQGKRLIKESGKNEKLYIGLGYYDLGEALYYQDKLDDAADNYLKAVDYFKLAEQTEMLASSYSNLGLVYLRRSKIDKALSFYEMALELELKLGNKLAQAKCYQNMGIIVGNRDMYELQGQYYKKAMRIYRRLNEKEMLADMAINLGVIYARQQKYDDAEANYFEALKHYEQMADSAKIASIYTNVGYLNAYQENYDKAENYFNNSITIFTRLDHKFGLVHAYQGMGDLLVAKGNKPEAIEMYLACEEVNNGFGILDVQASNLMSLYEAYKQIEDYENAIRVYEQYHAVKDSIYTIENSEKILELDNKYQHQKNLNELSQLKAENRSYIIIVIVSFSLSIFGATLLLFLVRYRRLKSRQIQLRLEQKVLRTQMNPHFIFNSLSAIQCYILENRVEDAVDFLADFAGLIRMVLDYSQVEFITLKQERDLLDFYLKLQSKRFGENIQYSIHVDESLELNSTLIPPMLSQPFIENSFEHGELNKRDGGKIEVSFSRCKEDCLCLVIKDNGIGINNGGHRKGHKSLATTITKERLKIINKNQVSTKLSLSVQDRSEIGEQGTKVMFKIPVLKQKLG